MKIAIKVLTDWDRINVIYFFEKHFPECNKAWHSDSIEIGFTFWVSYENLLFWDDDYSFKTPSDYTILQGVPKDFELPKVDNPILGDNSSLSKQAYINGELTKSREQELEKCFSELFLFVDDKNGTLEVVNGFRVSDILTKAKQLLNK